MARRRPTQVALSLTRAAAAVSQAVQNDAMEGDDAVRARPARRALVGDGSGWKRGGGAVGRLRRRAVWLPTMAG